MMAVDGNEFGDDRMVGTSVTGWSSFCKSVACWGRTPPSAYALHTPFLWPRPQWETVDSRPCSQVSLVSSLLPLIAAGT